MKISDEKSLKNRHRSEINFYDNKAQTHDEDSIYNQGAELNSFKKLMTIVGDIKDKRVLDFGCGTGWASVIYARKGAYVTGIDISHGALKKGKEMAMKENLQERIHFIQGSAESLPFREEYDIIIGISILHHLDLDSSVNSIKSVLRKGGRAIFFEPLAHNHILNLFRRITPGRRTKDEKPLNIKFINLLRSEFSEVNLYGSQLLSLISFIFYMTKAYRIFRRSNEYLCKIDEVIFKLFPHVQKYCWVGIIEIKK